MIGKKKVHGNLVNRKYSFKRKGAVPNPGTGNESSFPWKKEETFTEFHFQIRCEQIAESVSSPRVHTGALPNLNLALQGDNPVTI